jgi:hypothetical protein
MFTIQDRCNHFVSNNAVADSYSKLLSSRTNSLLAAFTKKGVEKQVTIHRDKSIVPHDGFSSYRIHYSGSIPQELQRSYDKLFDLNKRVLRQKYFKTTSSGVEQD